MYSKYELNYILVKTEKEINNFKKMRFRGELAVEPRINLLSSRPYN